MEVQSSSKDQGIIESSEADSSDSDDDFPLVSLLPKCLEKETLPQETKDKEMSPPPTEDFGDYSDPIPDMTDLIVRAVETLDNMTEVNHIYPLSGPCFLKELYFALFCFSNIILVILS